MLTLCWGAFHPHATFIYYFAITQKYSKIILEYDSLAIAPPPLYNTRSEILHAPCIKYIKLCTYDIQIAEYIFIVDSLSWHRLQLSKD